MFNYLFDNYVFRYRQDEPMFDASEIYTDHIHFSYEALYIYEGVGDILIGLERYEVKPNALFFIKPGTLHTITIDNAHKYSRLVIHFIKDDLPLNIAKQIDSLSTYIQIEDPLIINQMQNYIRFGSSTVYSDLIRELLISMLVTSTVMLISNNSQPVSSKRSAFENNDFYMVKDYIDSFYYSINSIKDIVRATNISKTKINTMFKKNYNVSPMTYIHMRKCLRADELIRNGRSSSEACNISGYNDYSTFYRNYKKIFKKAPKETTK